jgi:hypothetical protein
MGLQSRFQLVQQCELLVQECVIAVVDGRLFEVHSTSKDEKLN